MVWRWRSSATTGSCRQRRESGCRKPSLASSRDTAAPHACHALIGADNAIEWIASGKEQKAEQAHKCGAVDAVVSPELLRDASVSLLQQCIDGKLDFRAKRREKMEPLQLSKIEATMVFETSKAFVAAQAGPHYPAPVTAIKVMEKAADMSRDDALKEEARGIARMAGTLTAKNLVGLFLGDQVLGKTAKDLAKKARKVERAAVLGAGIMGGGIAYQSARKGTPIIMKDIAQAGIDLGLTESQQATVQTGRTWVDVRRRDGRCTRQDPGHPWAMTDSTMSMSWSRPSSRIRRSSTQSRRDRGADS